MDHVAGRWADDDDSVLAALVEVSFGTSCLYAQFPGILSSLGFGCGGGGRAENGMESGVVCSLLVRAICQGLHADLRADAAFQLDGDVLGDCWGAGWVGGNRGAVAVAGGGLKVVKFESGRFA